MEPAATAIILAAVGALLIMAGVASPISERFGIPALLIFLVLGMLAGSEGLGGIPFEDYDLSFRLGTIALVLILFDGGLNTPLASLRRVAVPAGLLATVAVVVTAAIVAAAGVLVGLPRPISLLVGAVVSSTDAAAVFSVLRGTGSRLKEPAASILEVESGLNDPMAVLLTFFATEVVLADRAVEAAAGRVLALQLAVGVAGGLAAGFGGRLLLRSVRLPAAGLYPVLTVAIAFTSFGLTTVFEGSGFLAVYLAAVLLGAGSMPYRAGIRRVHDALAWLAQILMFLVLGLLVFPSRLVPLADEGVILAVTLALVARPLAVVLLLLPFRITWAERIFIAWVGLRGAVPIILATYPVLRGVPEGDHIFHLVFFVVLVNSIVPGMTVSWLARRLGLLLPTTVRPPASIELVSLREFSNEFAWYYVSGASAVAGALVSELPLPEGCVLTLLLRGDEVLVPHGNTRLEVHDHVCALVTATDRSFLDLLFGRAEDQAR